ncbi:MAG TPA: hypothetical protein VFH89_03390 [Sphingomicrobium sp.]|nr:hypothetical protein [Sphingomicrobium sp.]
MPLYAHIKGHIRQAISLKSVTRGLPRQVKIVNHRAAGAYNKVHGCAYELAE